MSLAATPNGQAAAAEARQNASAWRARFAQGRGEAMDRTIGARSLLLAPSGHLELCGEQQARPASRFNGPV
jgi:hypothetical protein